MIGNDWDKILECVYEKDYFIELEQKLIGLYKQKIIYPLISDIFNAFKMTSYDKVKVVILGQDPYHGEGEAEGLSFSVRNGIKIPPSLKNIFKELYDDVGVQTPHNGSLLNWAEEGVLLLNSILTVEKDLPASHRNIGWEQFTDEVIKILNEKENPIVFILWGNFARNKKKLITNKKHLIIESAHPSPFSANNGFFGSKPFSKTNAYLIKNGIKPVNWNL